MNFNFEHGANIYDYNDFETLNDFSSNTNPLGIPKHLNITLDLTKEKYLRYPDPLSSELVLKLAAYEKVSHHNIYVGSGASDIIFRLFTALKPQTTLLLAPTFSEYEKAGNTLETSFDYYSLVEENNFAINEDILDKINMHLNMMIICNPNNPTGQLIEQGLLVKIIEKCLKNKVYLLVDECFIDFVENHDEVSCKQYLNKNPYLIVLKAFTKIFSLAGFRLGYCMLDNKTLKNKLFAAGPDWPISTIAQEVGEMVLMDSQSFLAETLSVLETERVYLERQLEKLGFKVYQSYANYILFKNFSSINLLAKLLKKGFLIRSCANYRGLDESYYRICVKQRSDNDKLLESLKEVVRYG